MIRQIPAIHPLPDWRNLGVVLRVLVGVNGLALFGALLQAGDIAQWLPRFVETSALVEPLLLLVLGLLAAARGPLWRLPPRLGQAAVVAAVALLAVLQAGFWNWLAVGGDSLAWLRAALLAAFPTALLLVYFEQRSRAFSPSMTEARLAALNARIRSHFLFNSLNAVLSLIRA